MSAFSMLLEPISLRLLSGSPIALEGGSIPLNSSTFYPFSFSHVLSIPTDPLGDGDDFVSVVATQPTQNAAISSQKPSLVLVT